jgi:hypothetical protein
LKIEKYKVDYSFLKGVGLFLYVYFLGRMFLFPLCVLEFFVPSVSFRVFCSIGFKAFARYDPHALKGQKLLAQGNALGIKSL